MSVGSAGAGRQQAEPCRLQAGRCRPPPPFKRRWNSGASCSVAAGAALSGCDRGAQGTPARPQQRRQLPKPGGSSHPALAAAALLPAPIRHGRCRCCGMGGRGLGRDHSPLCCARPAQQGARATARPGALHSAPHLSLLHPSAQRPTRPTRPAPAAPHFPATLGTHRERYGGGHGAAAAADDGPRHADGPQQVRAGAGAHPHVACDICNHPGPCPGPSTSQHLGRVTGQARPALQRDRPRGPERRPTAASLPPSRPAPAPSRRRPAFLCRAQQRPDEAEPEVRPAARRWRRRGAGGCPLAAPRRPARCRDACMACMRSYMRSAATNL